MSQNAETKTVFASKTIAVNAIIALATLYPPIGAWVSANPELTLHVLAAINIGIRFLSKKRLALFAS